MNTTTVSAAGMKVHELADLFPAMSTIEFDALVDDIRVHGQREPVYLHDGRVLDGRHRLHACEKLGLQVRVSDYEGDDPLGFIISLNLHRRHLDESQRAMVAAKIAKLPKGANQHASIEAPSQAKAADLLNVGRASVQRAREVLDHGSPELVQAVERGEVSVSAAAKKVRRPTTSPTPTPSSTSSSPVPTGKKAGRCCSFCGKSLHEVVSLVSGPSGPSVCICDECVGVALITIKPERAVEIILTVCGYHPIKKIMGLPDEPAPTSCAQEGAGATIATPPATAVSPKSQVKSRQTPRSSDADTTAVLAEIVGKAVFGAPGPYERKLIAGAQAKKARGAS